MGQVREIILPPLAVSIGLEVPVYTTDLQRVIQQYGPGNVLSPSTVKPIEFPDANNLNSCLIVDPSGSDARYFEVPATRSTETAMQAPPRRRTLSSDGPLIIRRYRPATGKEWLHSIYYISE